MMGKVDPQGKLFRSESIHLDYVGRESVYGWFALHFRTYFRDEDFADMYVLDNGRRSVPPSQLLMMLFLQNFERLSDEAAIERARYDLRWKVALRLYDQEGLCAKSTLQMFRAKLVLHKKYRALLERSVRVCREAGVLKHRKIKSAIDTSPIFGRGAVKDTYNLIADGIVKLLRQLAAFTTPSGTAVSVESYAREHDFLRYITMKSVKGEANIDWDDDKQVTAFLAELITDAKRVVRIARTALHDAAGTPDDMRSGTGQSVKDALSLLEDILEQDVEEDADDGAQLKDGVAKDRIPSVHDPEMRHGRKSAQKRFDGYKGEMVVDEESGTIVDASVKPGNEHDSTGSLEAVVRAEKTLQEAWDQDPEDSSGAECVEIEETIGDCAYGTAENRRDFSDAGRTLTAKQARLHNDGRYTKDEFPVDEETGERVCPAGHRAAPKLRTKMYRGRRTSFREYQWSWRLCESCPFRDKCTKVGKGNKKKKQPQYGRTIREHPDEEMLAAAREQQEHASWKKRYRLRQTVERCIARLMQLGVRQAKYFGRAKTEFQWVLASATANLLRAASC